MFSEEAPFVEFGPAVYGLGLTTSSYQGHEVRQTLRLASAPTNMIKFIEHGGLALVSGDECGLKVISDAVVAGLLLSHHSLPQLWSWYRVIRE